MKHLLLFRHAKSSWANMDLLDFDRPLNERGMQAAQNMANYLSQHLPLPDVILCSTARRTRQTLSALLQVYAHPVDIALRRCLYHASETVLIDEITKAGTSDVLMLIGHNPGLEMCAHVLCGAGDENLRADLAIKFPTAACVHLTFDISDWAEVKQIKGSLANFIKPRALDVD